MAARATAAAARAQAAVELKPAPWAAAIEGTNQKKGWNAAIDKTGLDECPVCLEEKADVKMEPCGHTCCGGCIDQWMSQKSSFAQTLRTGSSDTTCPLCRAAVTSTVAATPVEGAALVEGAATAAQSAAPSSKVEGDVKDWMALAEQRHAEVVAKARAMRGEPSVSAGRELAPSAPKTPPKPKPSNGASKSGSSSIPHKATYKHPNSTSWSVLSSRQEKHGKKKAPEDRGARISDGADVDAMLGDAMQARFAAVTDDDDAVPPAPEPAASGRKTSDDPWTQEEKHRRQEHEEAKAHALWIKAQTNAAAKGTEAQRAPEANHASQGVQASGVVNSAESADKKEISPSLLDGAAKGPAAMRFAGSPHFGNAFHSGFGGGLGAFGRVPTKEDEARLTLEEEQLKAARREAAEAKEATSRAIAHADTERQAAGMLRTELACFKDQLAAEQKARATDRQRAELAEATVEVLKQQLPAFQEQLDRMRKAERAKDEECRRLQDDYRSLARAHEEAKASVMKMWDQLEKKDQEVGALKSYGGPPNRQGGVPPGQMYSYPTNPETGRHSGLMQLPSHPMQPQSMPSAQPHVSHEARTACTYTSPGARAFVRPFQLIGRCSLDLNIRGNSLHLRIMEPALRGSR